MIQRSLLMSAVIGMAIVLGQRVADGIVEDTVWRDQLRCGVNSSYIFLRLEDINVDYEDVLEAMGPTTDGTSIKQIRDYLNQFDLNLQVIKSKPSQLSRMSLPAVVFMEPEGSQSDAMGHFNVLVAVDNKNVTYIDGTTGGIWEKKRDSFTKEWSGIVLTEPTPSNLPYLVFCILGCSFLVFQLRRWFNRKAVIAALIAFGMLCVVPDSASAQSIQDIIDSLIKRNKQLESGRVTFTRYAIEDGQAGFTFYEVDYAFDGQKRYLKHTQFKRDGTKSSSLRGFDGKFFLGWDSGSYQLHNVESALAFEVNRFDTLYLVYSGFYVSDPLLGAESQQRRKSNSLLSRLQSNDFSLEVNDGLLVLTQRNFSKTDKTRDIFEFDPCLDNMIVKRTVLAEDGEKLSEFRYLDYRRVDGTSALVPGTVELRPFDYEGNVDGAFGLSLIDFEAPLRHQIPPKSSPLTGAYLVDYTHINRQNKDETSPVVSTVAATGDILDKSIEKASVLLRQSARWKSSSWNYIGRGVLVVICISTIMLGFFQFLANSRR